MGSLLFKDNRFIWKGSFHERKLAESANFSPDPGSPGLWITEDPFKALRLFSYSDQSASKKLIPVYGTILASKEIGCCDTFNPPIPQNLVYFDYQKACIDFGSKSKITLVADEMGTGKTIEAAGIGNYQNLDLTLVICPASLRLKWLREFKKWSLSDRQCSVLLGAKSPILKDSHIITSYEMLKGINLEVIKRIKWDHIIIDECHYLINYETIRFQNILGKLDSRTNTFLGGLIQNAKKATLLSGTPIVNFIHDFYQFLKAINPSILGKYVNYRAFLTRFCDFTYGDRNEIIILGSKNEWEMFNRLAGSGFMIRRERREVLPQLPQEQYNLILIPEYGEMKNVLKKERRFSADEIVKFGINKFPALPQLRREMGEAKVPFIIEFSEMLLKSTEKIIIGAYHVSVIAQIYEALEHYNPAVIDGSVSTVKREFEINRFQTDPKCRVFIGNLQAAGEGHDLTAAFVVVIAEPDWTPRKNQQFISRAVRIGQKNKVLVFFPMAENSLDFQILNKSLFKEEGIEKTLNGDF